MGRDGNEDARESIRRAFEDEVKRHEDASEEDRALFLRSLGKGQQRGDDAQARQPSQRKRHRPRTPPSIAPATPLDGAVSKEDEALFLQYVENLHTAPDKDEHEVTTRKKKTRVTPKDVKHAHPKERVDLHGLTADRAKQRLSRFILSCYANGTSPVLIIHGKGLHSEQGSVIRHVVEDYFKGEGARYLRHIATPPERLGGDGAKLVWLTV